MNTKTVIIVAGGKGERMKTDIPKQFLEINEKPILMHTLEVFHRYDANIQLVLVLPENQVVLWNELCIKYSFSLKHQVIIGGNTRFQSVKNGLNVVEENGLVAVHDGVRPLVSIETIQRCFVAAGKFKTAVPVVEMVESIRKTNETSSESVDRNSYKMVQTPQVFEVALLKKAYEQEFSEIFTDDASVVEAMGEKIQLVEGNRENIKITTEFDLKLTKLLINE